jgi:hypothetical protein
MPLSHRLRILGGGFTAKLSISLSRSATALVTRSHLTSMCFIYNRVASVRAAAHLEAAFQRCLRAQAACDFASAAAGYRQLVELGHLASHAELAWILIDGRKGLAQDIEGGFRIAQQGSRLGCMHSRGVLSYCHVYSYGCEEDLCLGMRLALDSAAAGSKFGQLMLGAMHRDGRGGATLDIPRTFALYQRAADQGLDAAAFRYSWGKPAANQLKPQTQFFHPGSASCTAFKASRRWRSVSSRSPRGRATPGRATSLVSSMPTGLELRGIGMRL